ncbi:MAG: 4Fe-4S binding protein [Chitinispirillaceae bacterium]|jgi:hypothetical protein|nr:4Fe-4S binding protein [Chitinispirillaceae bacterium]
MLSALVTAQTANKSTIFKSKCVGCGDCVRICPVQAITMVHGKAVVDADKCVGCGLCVTVCSYGAPRIREQETASMQESRQKPRNKSRAEKIKKQNKGQYSPDAMNALDSIKNEK